MSQAARDLNAALHRKCDHQSTEYMTPLVSLLSDVLKSLANFIDISPVVLATCTVTHAAVALYKRLETNTSWE